jgi:hypothetical protein
LESVRGFYENVSARNITSLEILRQVDEVVDWLSGMRKATSGDIEFAHNFAEVLKVTAFDREIDPDGIIASGLERANKAIDRLIEILQSRLQAAKDDPKLRGEHKQCVMDEYVQTIGCYTEMRDAINGLYSAIRKHDTSLDKVIGPFDDVEELIASLKG